MKIVYYMWDGEYGEIEGMFDEQGELIGSWHSNDAHWRQEYFGKFMRNLGVEVKPVDPHMHDVLLKKLRYACGVSNEE